MKNAELAEQGLKLAITLAHMFQRGIRTFHVENSDLEGAAILGLVYAARNFEPGHGRTFNSWAVLKIRGCLIDFVAADNVKRKKVPVYDEIIDDREQRKENVVLMESIGKLPKRLALLIRLRFFEGYTHPEVASILRLSLPRLWQLQRAALEQLKTELKRRGIRSVQDVL